MADELIDMILEEADEKMGKAVAHARGEFSSIRTGRASPALVEKLPVNYYGSEVPMQQLASFSVPEARQLLITPFDKGAMEAMEKAIQNADLGLNPSNDGPGAEFGLAWNRLAIRGADAAAVATELEAVECAAEVLALHLPRAEVRTHVGAIRIGQSSFA